MWKVVLCLLGGVLAMIFGLICFANSSSLERPRGMWSGSMGDMLSIMRDGGVRRTNPTAIVFGVIGVLGSIGLFVLAYFLRG